jgi:O-antigen/teichoic acid export membrane protein
MVGASQANEVAGVRPILRRVLSNAGLLLGGRTVNAVIGLGYMAMAARALGASQLGIVVLIQAFAEFLGEVVKFQSWQTLLHFGARPLAEGRKRDFQQVLRLTLLLDLGSTLIGIAIGVVGALAFAGRLGWSSSQAPAAALAMLTIAFMVSATPVGLLRLFDRFDVMARQAALISILRFVGGAIAFLTHAPMEGFLAAWAFSTLGSWLYLAGSALRELKRRGLLEGFTLRGPLTKGLPGILRFAWNTNLSATLDVAFTDLVTLMVGGLVGPAQAAFWRVGRQVADAMAKPAKLVTFALYPELARLRAEDRHDAMWRLAKQIGLLAGGSGLVLLLAAAVAGRPLLGLVLGQGFGPAASVMVWQVAAAVVGIFALPLEPMLISLGNPGAAVRVRLVVSVAFLLAMPVLAGRYGLTGAGAGLVGASTALAVGMLLFILRENGNRRPSAPTAPVPDDRLKGEA